MQRDLRIDFVRGAGVLMIAADHLPGLLHTATGGPITSPFITWMRLGWSSAAEFFVFFSGYLVGLIYMQTLRNQGVALTYARAGHRAWQIYVANVLALCAVLILLRLPLFHSQPLEVATRLDVLGAGGATSALIAFLTLQSAPAFFEILHLYVALLFVAPLLLLVARRSIVAAIACSVAVWACVQWNPSLNIASWNFNPFAWQLVFVLGMMCSVGRVLEKLTEAFGRRRLLIVSGSLLLLALMVKVVDKAGWSLPLLGAIDVTGIDRTTVGPLLLLHFVVSVVFVMQVVPRGQTIARSAALALVARVGQYSLECFCVSTVLVYAAVGWMSRTGYTGPLTIFVTGMLVMALIGLWAVLINWLRAQPWRSSSAAGAAQDSVSVPEATSPRTTMTDTRSIAAGNLPREPA